MHAAALARRAASHLVHRSVSAEGRMLPTSHASPGDLTLHEASWSDAVSAWPQVQEFFRKTAELKASLVKEHLVRPARSRLHNVLPRSFDNAA